MHLLFDRPWRVYVGLVVALVASFALSAVGNTGTPEENAQSSVAWIGAIGWFAFGLTLLALVLYTIALLLRRVVMRRRGQGAAL